MGDFLINELKEEEGVWTIINDNLTFINKEETQYHLPIDTKVLHYEVYNFSKDIFFISSERKQFRTFKSAVKDATKKLENKPSGYRYGVCATYQKKDGSTGQSYVAIIKKELNHLHFHVPNLRSVYQNGTLDADEIKELQKAPLPDSWLAKRRVRRPIILLEKELMDVHHVKEILYTASHPHQEKEQFLFTLERYFSVLSEQVDRQLFAPLTICHGKNKRFTGYYASSNHEMILQPKKYKVFFHLYWFHLYYETLHLDSPNPFTVQFDQLVKNLYETETLKQHRERHQHMLDKDGLLTAAFADHPAGIRYQKFTDSNQMVARLFSDYFFHHYEEHFETHQKKRSFHYKTEEIDALTSSLEQLVKDMQEVMKKKP